MYIQLQVFICIDDNLQSHGTRGLSTPMLAGGNSNTLVRGRTLSHSMRKAKRLNTISVPGRYSEIPRNESLVCNYLITTIREARVVSTLYLGMILGFWPFNIIKIIIFV